MPSEVKFQCTSSKLSELKSIAQNIVCNFQEECQFKSLKYSLIFVIKKKKIRWEYPTCFLNAPVGLGNFSYSSTTYGILSMNDINLEIPRGF